MSAPAKAAYRPIGLAGSMLASAAVHGAVFAVAKTALDRGGARLFERATGAWPVD